MTTMYAIGQTVIERTGRPLHYTDSLVTVTDVSSTRVTTDSGLTYTAYGTHDGELPIDYRSIRHVAYKDPSA